MNIVCDMKINPILSHEGNDSPSINADWYKLNYTDNILFGKELFHYNLAFSSKIDCNVNSVAFKG